MRQYYQVAQISKQGHAQAVKQQRRFERRERLYIGFIDQIRQDHPSMGLRAMYEQFQPAEIGRDHFISLGLAHGYRVVAPRNYQITTRPGPGSCFANLLVDVKLTGVNQVWVSDLFYISWRDEHYYGVLIMDLYSRRIIGYSVADNMQAERTYEALTMALDLRGVDDYAGGLIHHSDRGSQYTSRLYTDTLMAYNIQISMCANVLENAHAERVNGRIKNDYLAHFDQSTPTVLVKSFGRSIAGYNMCGHGSLPNKMTPLEYEAFLRGVPLEERTPMSVWTELRNAPEIETNQLNLFSKQFT